jgi:uncharacterized protein YdiU (UPF0061 family)
LQDNEWKIEEVRHILEDKLGVRFDKEEAESLLLETEKLMRNGDVDLDLVIGILKGAYEFGGEV